MKTNVDLDKYLEVIRDDYREWQVRCAQTDTAMSAASRARAQDIRVKMIKEFVEGVSFTAGSKYIKVVTGGSVHSFVVNSETDSKFPLGTILKAASWKTPARNFGRGNVLEETFDGVRWTGVM